jgi:hypothetical protein
MKKQDAYPSKYFKAADFKDDWTLTVEIELARLEEIGSDGKKNEKLVCYFRRQKPGLVVGPTVFDQIADATGEGDSDDWKGHHVELYRDWTNFQGKSVPCIRVRKPNEPPAKKKPAKKPAPTGGGDLKTDLNDEIMF